MHADAGTIDAMLAAGAVTCLTKDGSSEALLAAIRDHGGTK